MRRFFAATTFVVAVAFLPAITAQAAALDDVEIKSVDNYAGYSNVYTNRPQTTVTITHSNGEHWTGTTDSDGKLTINSGYTLSKEYLKIKLASQNQPAVVEGMVVPDSIQEHKSFSFAATHVAEGEVISIQTAEGVVVQSSAADKYGRVFLSAGLPAGTYLISSSSSSQSLGKMEVEHRAGDVLQHSRDSLQPIQLQNVPHVLKLSDPFSLSGHGFSSNFSDMQVGLTSSGKTEAPVVLAATEDQLKLAPVQQLQPGAALLRITNQATSQSTDSFDVLLYNIQGNLERRSIKSGGDKTQLVITVQPENLPLNVRVAVASGPVDFGDGRKQAESVTTDGRAVFPVHAEHGSGPFKLTWEVAEPASTKQGSAKTTSGGTNNAAHKQQSGTAKSGCSCGCGGSAQPRCPFKSCGCSG